MAAVAVSDEAGDELELEEDDFLERRLATATAWLSRGHGTFGFTIHDRAGASTVGSVAWRDADTLGPVVEQMVRGLAPSLLRELGGRSGSLTLRSLAQQHPVLRVVLRTLTVDGVRDLLFVVAPTPRAEALVLGAMNHAPIHLSKQACARFEAPAAELAAAYATFRALARQVPAGARAEALRGVARDRDAEVGPARSREVSDLWREMASGELRVVDHHDHDGRRYLVAVEGTQPGPELDELQVEALSMLADGYTQKEIADALAISPATVSRRLAAALETMGLRSTAEAVALFGSTLQSED